MNSNEQMLHKASRLGLEVKQLESMAERLEFPSVSLMIDCIERAVNNQGANFSLSKWIEGRKYFLEKEKQRPKPTAEQREAALAKSGEIKPFSTESNNF